MQCRKQIMRNSGVKQRNGSSEPSSCWGTPHATGPWWSLTHVLPRFELRLSTRSFRTCRWIKSIGSCWRLLSKPPECTAPQQKPIISIQKSYLLNSTLEGFEGMTNIVMLLFCCFPPAWLNFDFGSQVVQGSFLWENVSFLAVSVDRGSKQYWNDLKCIVEQCSGRGVLQITLSKCCNYCGTMHSCKQCKHTFPCCVNSVKHLQPGNMTLLQRDHQSVQIFSLDSHHLNDLHVALNAHSLSFLHSGPWKHSLSELMICAKYLKTQPWTNKATNNQRPGHGKVHPSEIWSNPTFMRIETGINSENDECFTSGLTEVHLGSNSLIIIGSYWGWLDVGIHQKTQQRVRWNVLRNFPRLTSPESLHLQLITMSPSSN